MESLKWWVNRQPETIYVSVHDAMGNAVEFFRLSEGHSAFDWTDERLIEYLTNKLKERKTEQ